ncbi:16439_t:CDS:2 [Entrophospora sp. SA101]|nr:16439_t:CDS:2 [Entrophospora sp. SA101]
MFKNASSAIRATTDEGRLNGLLGTNSRTPDILKGIGDVSEDKIDESTRAKHTEQNDIDDEDVCVPKIEDIVLEDPKGNDDTRGRVLKKYYKHYGIYVACKSDKFLEEKQKGFPHKIKKHVTNNGRETIDFKSQGHEVKESQDEYLRIMKEDSACRPTFQKIVLDLNNLITKEKTKIGDLSWLRHRNEAEKALKRTPSPSKADQIEGFNLDSKTPPSSSSSIKSILSKTSMIKGNTPETKQPSKIQNIPTMLVGIAQHKKGNKKEALKIFIEHEKLHNKTAKFWYGYYLLEGYAGLEKDKKKATEYFREAAEEGVPDAQLRYAHILLDDSKDSKDGPDPDTLEQIIRYFTLAADNKNSSARYLLGSLYYYGKHGVSQDKEKGLYYIKLAAIQKHYKALALLKDLSIDPYQ